MMNRVKDFKDIQTMEEKYQGVWNESLIGDFCWMLYHDDPTHAYKWKSYATHFKIFILEVVLIAVLSGAQVESNRFVMLFLTSLS